MKKWSILVGTLMVISMLLAACGGGGSQTIKVGVVAELTGDIPAVGASCKNAAELAVKEINDAGGLEVAGKKYQVELFIEDNAGKADQSASAAQKLITQQNVVAIVGPNASRYAIPASEIAESSKVMLISPWSTNPDTTFDRPWVFRAAFLDPFQGEVVASLAMELGAQNAAVLFDVGNDYVKGLAEYFKASFEALGGTVSVYEAYNKEDTDFSAVLGKVAAAAPDVIFLPDYYNKNNLIAAQIQEKGIEATLLGADGWDSPELQTELFEGGYFSNHYSPADPRPVVQNFVAAYTANYGAAPDAFATLSYDAAKILLQSISEAGVDDPAAVKDAMSAIQYEGVSGKITFDEFVAAEPNQIALSVARPVSSASLTAASLTLKRCATLSTLRTTLRMFMPSKLPRAETP